MMSRHQIVAVMALMLVATFAAVASLQSTNSRMRGGNRRHLEEEDLDYTDDGVMDDHVDDLMLMEEDDDEYGDDDDDDEAEYWTCPCPCVLADSNEEGVVMQATDATLFSENGSPSLCVTDDMAISFIESGQAECDDSCFLEEEAAEAQELEATDLEEEEEEMMDDGDDEYNEYDDDDEASVADDDYEGDDEFNRRQ